MLTSRHLLHLAHSNGTSPRPDGRLTFLKILRIGIHAFGLGHEQESHDSTEDVASKEDP